MGAMMEGGWSGGRAEQAERAERAGMHWSPLKSFDCRAWGRGQEPQSRGLAVEAWEHWGSWRQEPWRHGSMGAMAVEAHGGRGAEEGRSKRSGRACWAL